MSALSIQNLSKSFGSHLALRDISIDVASGEFICLLGGSVCGKTTLLRLIAGLETHNSGDNVAYGMRLTGTSKSKITPEVTRLLDMVGLSGMERRSAASLSGGQRQRVAIARALA